jgi:hypothetical protein
MFVKPACASPLWLPTSRAVAPGEEPRIVGHGLLSRQASEIQFQRELNLTLIVLPIACRIDFSKLGRTVVIQ